MPEIPVSDIAAATTYYRDRLSFTLDWVEPDIALAGLSRSHTNNRWPLRKLIASANDRDLIKYLDESIRGRRWLVVAEIDVTACLADHPEAGTMSTLAYLQGPGARTFLEQAGVQFWIV